MLRRQLSQERTIWRLTIQPILEYRLTPLGETLLPVLESMYAWGQQTREGAAARNAPRDPAFC